MSRSRTLFLCGVLCLLAVAPAAGDAGRPRVTTLFDAAGGLFGGWFGADEEGEGGRPKDGPAEAGPAPEEAPEAAEASARAVPGPETEAGEDAGSGTVPDVAGEEVASDEGISVKRPPEEPVRTEDESTPAAAARREEGAEEGTSVAVEPALEERVARENRREEPVPGAGRDSADSGSSLAEDLAAARQVGDEVELAPETILGELEKPDIFFLVPRARSRSDEQLIRARIRREITKPLIKDWLEEELLLE